MQGGVYIQDDIKIRKNLTVTGGVRYEAQTHVPDKLNFAPRVGVHVGAVQERQDDAPRQLGHVLRLAADRHLSADAAGRRRPPARAQHRQSVIPRSRATSGRRPPTNRYLLAEERDMAYSQRLSAGIAQGISRRITTNVLYSYSYRYSLLTGRNINTPVNGVRPDPRLRQRRPGDVGRAVGGSTR